MVKNVKGIRRLAVVVVVAAGLAACDAAQDEIEGRTQAHLGEHHDDPPPPSPLDAGGTDAQAASGAPQPEPGPVPTVATDKIDYQPGETATITGSGFLGGDTITLQVRHADSTAEGGAGHEPFTTTAAADGSFTATWYVNPDDSLGSLFRLTAAGTDGTTAEVMFTDAATISVVVNRSDSGWYNNTGLHDSANMNYLAGYHDQYRNFFVFDLAAVTGNVVAATVRAKSPDTSGAAAFVLRDVTTAIATLTTSAVGRVDIFQDLGTGAVYGSATGTDGKNKPIEVTLNATGLAALRAAVGGKFAVGGTYGVPSSSSFAFSSSGGGGNGEVQLVLTVEPNRAPVARCAARTVCGANGCTATAAIDDGSSDPDGDALTITYAPAGPYALGTTAVTMTVRDPSGAESSCTANVTVSDCTGPQLTCPATQTVECTGDLVATVTPAGATAADQCSTATVTPPASGAYALGSTTVTYSAADAAGNTASCSATITVVDTQAPSLSCPAATNVECTSPDGATVDLPPAAGSDACTPAASLTVTDPASQAYPLGATTVAYAATDTVGLQASCTTTVNVVDTVAPQLTCPAPSVAECTGDGKATVDPGVATGTDACSTAVSPNVPGAGAYALGDTTVTYAATDASGNAGSCTTTVKVQDTTAPTITCDAPIVVGTAPGFCRSGDLTPGANAADVCGPASVGGARGDGLAVLGSYPVGSTNVVFTAKDGAGLTASCTQVVTVRDTEAPTIVCAPMVVANDAGQCSATIAALTAPAVGDNCAAGAPVAQRLDGAPLNAPYPVGTTQVQWTVQDIAGNVATCTQLVQVKDMELPVVATSDVTVPTTVAGTCEAPATYSVQATDNCGVVSTAAVPPSGSSFPFGTTTVNATATDAAGNVGAGTFQVSVAKIAATASIVVAPNPQQYSDLVTFTASVTPAACDQAGGGQVAVGGSVEFRIDAQVMGTAAVDATGTAAKAGVALLGAMDPALAHVATAVFSGTSGAFVLSNPTTPLTITKENATATYTGALFVSTVSVTSGAASVTLAATIKDITAEDPASDPNAGDIRNAKVTFVNRDSGATLCTAPVGLVNAADTRVGAATCNWAANIGSADAQSFTVGVVVGGYYTRNSSADNVVVQVAKPLGTSFITGGGYLALRSPGGVIAPAVGSKNNFGFNVKYNKSGTNLQGNVNTIVRSGGRVYQIKGNVLTSLSAPGGGAATFNGRASIQDITDPLAPVAVDGNATLQVVMTDRGEPGSTDGIAITVWNKAGGLWFSSSWNGTRTVEQTLGGGNLVVR